ncbi:MAG: GNA1162 family protein [Desulfococcaceae bacterium]
MTISSAILFRFLILGLLPFLLTPLAGCARSKPPVSSQGLHTALARGNCPRTIAVLPFNDHTGTEGLAELVRINLLGRLSALPYRDVERDVVDRRLAAKGIVDRETLYETPVQRLGRLLGADALLYGDVTEFQRVFVGVYTRLKVTVGIQIWDARNGRKLWADTYAGMSQEGGVPLSLLDLPMITVRSGLHLSDEVKLQVVDEAVRNLVDRLPRPGALVAEAGSRYEVQAGAFSAPERARELRDRLQARGFSAFIGRNVDDRGVWHRVLVGPFADQESALAAAGEIEAAVGARCFIARRNR